MLLLSIFQTVEFYVIAAVVAASVVAAAALPKRRGPVRTFLYGGEMLVDTPVGEAPAIEVTVDPSGHLTICRSGLAGLTDRSAWSLAVQISGFDVTINERIVPGRQRAIPDDETAPQPATAARAVLDCFGRERYHFRYLSEATGSSCAFTMSVAPGARLRKTLEV